MYIRKATVNDIPGVVNVYEGIHSEEEAGRCTTGWVRSIYPTKETAEAALEREDLFVMEEEEEIVGTAVINQIQVDVYVKGAWKTPAEDQEIMVLHTLVISPEAAGKGYGKAFVRFYEEYARAHRCRELRIDTNERNKVARKMYAGLGYREVGIVPTVFNGIPGIRLVLLEKTLQQEMFHVKH